VCDEFLRVIGDDKAEEAIVLTVTQLSSSSPFGIVQPEVSNLATVNGPKFQDRQRTVGLDLQSRQLFAVNSWRDNK
jgi:hypothetical protein